MTIRRGAPGRQADPPAKRVDPRRAAGYRPDLWRAPEPESPWNPAGAVLGCLRQWASCSTVSPRCRPAPGPGLFDMFLHAGAMGWLVAGVLVAAVVRLVGDHDRQVLPLSPRRAHSPRSSSTSSAAASASARSTPRPAGCTASPLVGIFQAGYVEIDAQVKAARQEGGRRARGGLPDPSRWPASSAACGGRIGVELALLARQLGLSRHDRGGRPLHRPVRHGLGHHGGVPGHRRLRLDLARRGRAGHRRGADQHRRSGLAAAIPALIGYNFFANRLRAVPGTRWRTSSSSSSTWRSATSPRPAVIATAFAMRRRSHPSTTTRCSPRSTSRRWST